MSLLLFWTSHPRFCLSLGLGINESRRITRGEGNENSAFFAFRRSCSRIIFFVVVLLSRFFEGLHPDFLFSSFIYPPVAGRWASAPWTAALLPAHLLWIFRTLVWTDGSVRACERACEKSQPTENILSACVIVFVRFSPPRRYWQSSISLFCNQSIRYLYY